MSATLERLEYGFDRDSRRTWRRRSLTTGEDNAYAYDGLSQVVQAARGDLNLNATAIGGVPAEAQAWDYDPTGNWRGYETKAGGSAVLDQRRVHDKGNRLTQIEGAPKPVLLDRAGRMREVAPDAGGNWNESQQVKWDAWSRVTQVRRKSDGAVLGSYTYDGLTRRLTQNAGSTTTHTYYSDAWRPLEERRDSQTVPARQYYWGARHRDDLVRRDRATTSGGPLNETRYVLMDYFSPAAITDGSGAVKERYAFSAFGVRRILTPAFGDRATSECDFTFGFQGQFLDAESGFLNYGYRYYSPHLGRWLSKDPIENFLLYSLVANNPVNFTDYLGLVENAVECSMEYTESRKFAGETAHNLQVIAANIGTGENGKCTLFLSISGEVVMRINNNIKLQMDKYPSWMREGSFHREPGIKGVEMHEQCHAGAYMQFVNEMVSALQKYEIDYDTKEKYDEAVEKAKKEFEDGLQKVRNTQGTVPPGQGIEDAHQPGWNKAGPYMDYKMRGDIRPR